MRAERLVLALRMVWRRPLRSALAALGLGVALAALLVAVAIAEKGRMQAEREISGIGANVLTVSAEPSRNRGGRVRTGDGVRTLTLEDVRAIAREVTGLAGTAAEYRTELPVKAGNLVREPRVAGIEPAYASLRAGAMRSGRFFDNADDAQGQRVAVLGGRIARDLFPGRDPVGEPIRLGGIPFTVLGVMAERGSGLDAFNEDEVIFIPLKTARRRLFQVDYVQRVYVRVGEASNLPEASRAILALLEERHHRVMDEARDFRVQDQTRLVDIRETTLRRLRAFQVEVSVALLTASALGIFALQLLSVRERRAEIGTRRALGATRPMIFRQFLVEALSVCLSGALTGIALAAAGTVLAQAAWSMSTAAAAFLACCAAGVAAAVAPARAAAALHPAVALRAQ